MLATTLLIVLLIDILVLIGPTKLSRQGEHGQTPATPRQATHGHQTGQPVFATAILAIFVLHILVVIENLAGQRQAGDLAASAHAACQKKLGQVAFIAIAVQPVTDGYRAVPDIAGFLPQQFGACRAALRTRLHVQCCWLAFTCLSPAWSGPDQ